MANNMLLDGLKTLKPHNSYTLNLKTTCID
jgi:hypothetical protein